MKYIDDYGDDPIDTGSPVESAFDRGFDVFGGDFGAEQYSDPYDDLAVTYGDFGAKQSRRRKIAEPAYEELDYYADPPDELAQAPQVDPQQQLLSRRARIRQQLLRDEGEKFTPDKISKTDRFLLGIGEGTLSGASGIGEAIGAVTPEFIGKDFTTLSKRARKKASTYAIDDDESNFDFGDFSQVMGAGVASLIPTLVGGVGGGLLKGANAGYKAAIAMGAIQQGGSTYQSARDRFVADGESQDAASWYALPLGVASGLITAGVTAGFGKLGFGLEEAIRRGLATSTLKSAIATAMKDVGMEAAEEGIDQLAQGVMEKYTYNPEKNWEQVVSESLVAAAAGGLIGGGVSGLRETAGRLAKQFNKPQQQGPKDQRTMEQALPFEQRNADLPEYMQDIEFDEIRNVRPAADAKAEVPPIDIPGANAPGARSRVWETKFHPSQVTTDGSGRSFLNIRRDLISELVFGGLISTQEASDIGRGTEAQQAAVFSAVAQRLEALGLAGLAANGKAMTVEALRRGRAGKAAAPAPPAQPAQKASSGPVPAMSRRGRQTTVLPPQERMALTVQQPTEAQQEAGNFKKGHVKVDGLDVAIENVEGSVRSKTGKDGKTWSVTMPADYGYVKGTKAKDGDNVDIYLGKNLTAPIVFVVDQINAETKKFDEHKVLYGFGSEQEAVAAYDAAFSDGKGPQRRGAVTPVSKDYFKEWLDSGNTKKPLAYKGGDQNGQKEGRKAETQGQEKGLLIPPTTSALSPALAPNQVPDATPPPVKIPTIEQASPPKAKTSPSKATGAVRQRVVHDDKIALFRSEVGQIQGKKQMKAGSSSSYGSLYDDAIRKNSLKPLFTNEKGKGRAPDDALAGAVEAGIVGPDASFEDLLALLIGEAESRKGSSEVQKAELAEAERQQKQRTDFEDLALRNKRNASSKSASKKQAISVDSMLIGDELKIGGETFVVSSQHFDDDAGRMEYVELSDGRKFGVQMVEGDQVIYPDAGTYKPSEVSFVDEEEGVEVPPQPEAQPQVPQGEQVRQDSIDGAPAEPQAGQVDAAQGTEAIRALVEGTNLPPAAKQVILAFLDQPVMRELDWSALVVELKNYIEGGSTGARLGNVIELTNNLNPTTFPHEVAHILYDFLPAEYKEVIAQARLQSIEEFQFTEFAGLLKPGTMTSGEFREQIMKPLRAQGVSDSIIGLLYRHTTDSEFLAHFVGEKFSKSAFVDRNGKSVWQKIRAWLRGLMDAIRRVAGMTPDMDRIYREMLAGTHKVNLRAAEEFESKQATYSFDAKEAANAGRLAKGAQERQIEADHQLAQGFDIVEFMNKFGASTMQYASQKMLRYLDYVGIRAIGEQLNNGVAESYQQVKRRLTDQYQLNWIARLAGQQIVALEANLKDVIAKADAGFKEITGKGFIRKLARLAKARQEKMTAEMITKVSTSVFNSAFEKATKALKEEALNDIDIARLNAQLDGIDEARRSSSAMSQLVTDMINVLMSTPQGQQLINDPNFGTRTDIADVYRDIARSAGKTLRNDGLISWASFILQKNKELRDTLLAAYYSQQSGIRNTMNAYETKFMADLEKNPIGTIRREMREAQKRTSEYEQARFAWMTLNKEVTEELNKYLILQDAAIVATGILNDPAWKAHKAEVFKDRGNFGTQKPFEPFTDKTLLMPDGSQVDVDTSHIEGSKTHFAKVRKNIENAIEKLRAWLADPKNADNDNFQIHERDLANLTYYFDGLDVLRPSDNTPGWNFTGTLIQETINFVGGRVAAMGRKAMASWNDMKRNAGWWNQEWSEKFSEARLKSLKSHDLKWGTFFGKTQTEANEEWWNNVGNQLFYSHSRQQGGLKVGDLLLSGWRVTQEDMDELSNVQAKSTSAGFDILEKHQKAYPGAVQTTMDSQGGATTFRRAMKGSENMVPRSFNVNLRAFAEKFVAAFNKKDAPGMIQQLNSVWEKIGGWMVWDRNADFADNTPFDGSGGAFEIIANRMAVDQNYVGSFDELVMEVAALSASPDVEVEAILLAEYGQMIKKWHNEAKTEELGSFEYPRGAESSNSTTRARGQALAPGVFYEYGFKSSRSISAFAGLLHSRAMDTMVAGLRAIREDISRQLNELSLEANQATALQDNARRVKNGDTYDRWNDLEEKQAKVQTLIDAMTRTDPNADLMTSFRRNVAALTGMLITGTITTTYNYLSGPMYLGQIANRISNAPLINYPWATWVIWMDQSAFRMIPSLGLSLVKTPVLGGIGLAKAVWNLGSKKGWSPKVFTNTALRDVVTELGFTVYNRVKHLREMQAQGLIQIPDFTKQFDNALLGSMMNQGKIPEMEIPTGKKIAQLPAVGAELMLLLLRTINPTFGDVAVNAGADAFFNSKLSPINMIEQDLRRLFKDWSKGKYRNFNFSNPRDEVNLLSAKEVYPASWYNVMGANEATLQNLRQEFSNAGMSFDEKAMEFLAELEKGNVQARFLSEIERTTLNNKFIDYVNRSSAVRTPLAFKAATFINTFISPFMFWKTRMFSSFNSMMSIPSQSDNKRLAQVASLFFTVLFPLLIAQAGLGVAIIEIRKLLARWLYDQELNIRQPWEREGVKSQAIGWSLVMLSAIPFLDIVANAALNDMPVRGSMDPNLVVLSKIKDGAQFVGGAIQTGDWTFKAPELIGGLVPDAKIVLNRLESEEGKRDSANALAVIRRKAPMEMLRPPFGGATGPSYTELSPYGPRMENAAMNGDVQEVVRLHAEATAKASEMGRADPDKAATQAFQSRNPYDRALKQKMTEGQRQQFLARLSPRERALVENMEQKFAVAADAIGANFRPAKEEPSLARGFRAPSLSRRARRVGGRRNVRGRLGRNRRSLGRGRTSLSRRARRR